MYMACKCQISQENDCLETTSWLKMRLRAEARHDAKREPVYHISKMSKQKIHTKSYQNSCLFRAILFPLITSRAA